MITRYSRKEMNDIWSEESKFDAYLKVEILASEAFSKLDVVPEKDIKLIREKAKFSVDRILEIEKETRHDIVAFTRCVSESLGDEKRWIHYGLTSTDVVDTAQGYRFLLANNIIQKDIERLLESIKDKAVKYKNTPCIGRTHGVHADITSFGLKFALFYDDLKRAYEQFNITRRYVECGKISGAVGNFANVDPFIQDYVCEKLGIESSSISTQVLQRDRHAHYMSTLAVIGSILEKISMEIRHLQRTEVRELEEGFKKGQKGSSAMPHKRNPISSENISGCSRVLRGYMISSFENIPLWHERDISHSSAERIIFADATTLLDYMLNRMCNVIDNLSIFEDNMLKNIYKTNKVIFSQRVLNALIEQGLSREEAYDKVQKHSMDAWNNNLDFEELINNDKSILSIVSKKDLKDCFTLDYYLSRVDLIYKRLGL